MSDKDTSNQISDSRKGKQEEGEKRSVVRGLKSDLCAELMSDLRQTQVAA